MRRFFQSGSSVGGRIITLTGSEARHAVQVLRLCEGDPAVILDGEGAESICVATLVGRREVQLRVERTIRHAPPQHRIRLVQAITKGRSLDLILQKAVELGAAEIQPLVTERVVARPDPGNYADKRDKWRQSMIEAAKQCGACWLPEILEPLTLPAALAAERGAELRLVAALGPGAAHPRAVFENFLASARRLPRSISVWIGPEGDFTPIEFEQLIHSGAKPITLGGQVLRSETAALSALAVLNHELTSPR